MAVDETENPGKTEKNGIIRPPEEKEREMTEDEVGVGIDAQGFWHFVIHSKKGLHPIIGFLEMSKDAVKAHYINQLRAEAASKEKAGLLRPENLSSIANRLKGKFKR